MLFRFSLRGEVGQLDVGIGDDGLLDVLVHRGPPLLVTALDFHGHLGPPVGLPGDLLLFQNPRLVLLGIDLDLEVMGGRPRTGAGDDLDGLAGGEQRLSRIVEPQEMPVLGEELGNGDLPLASPHLDGGHRRLRLRRGRAGLRRVQLPAARWQGLSRRFSHIPVIQSPMQGLKFFLRHQGSPPSWSDDTAMGARLHGTRDHGEEIQAGDRRWDTKRGGWRRELKTGCWIEAGGGVRHDHLTGPWVGQVVSWWSTPWRAVHEAAWRALNARPPLRPLAD